MDRDTSLTKLDTMLKRLTKVPQASTIMKKLYRPSNLPNLRIATLARDFDTCLRTSTIIVMLVVVSTGPKWTIP